MSSRKKLKMVALNAELGKPGSIGCVRMRGADIVELFDLVPPYTPVDIRA